MNPLLLLLLLRAIFTREALISLRNLLTAVPKFLKTLFPMFESTPAVDPPSPFDPSQPSIPISYPIKTLEDLASRAYFRSFHFPFNRASVPLPRPAAAPLPSRPRLLVCHDMQGGYGDDKWVQGGPNPGAYAIWHWHLIDVFVYFSHCLVTLPPPGWTNAAHRHGVKVLGTFITEWDEGKAICNVLLETEQSARMYAERLAELAAALGFDGWLINIENALDEGKIPNLKQFIHHLTQTMHSLVPGSLVIWYDSVTIHGALEWQDQLNEKNKAFFDSCDGIFVNYTWKSNYPEISATEAGDRRFDIYMGIDVFGRNTFGGGQWNTNAALDLLKKNNVSAAIFAPGWLYETQQPPDFQTAQNSWWDLVKKSWGRRNNFRNDLPFYMNFDRGHGYHISVEGEEVKRIPWNDMSCQNFQPLLEFVEGPTPESFHVFVDFNGPSYDGGGNITFKGNLEDDSHLQIKLFEGELLLGVSSLRVAYSVKSVGDSLLGLCLHFSSTMNKRSSVCLVSGNTNKLSEKLGEVIIANQVRGQETASGWIFYEGIIACSGDTLTEVHAICYKEIPGNSVSSLKEVDGADTSACRDGDYKCVIGHIALTSSRENSSFPPSSSWLVDGQHIRCLSVSEGCKQISLKISWRLRDDDATFFSKYNLYVVKITESADGYRAGRQESTTDYIGTTRVEVFYVSELAIPSDTSSLKFIIQVCGFDGTCQKLEDSPCYLVDIEGDAFSRSSSVYNRDLYGTHYRCEDETS